MLSRESSSSTFPPGVKIIRANYDSVDSLVSAFQGQDAVISLVGGAAFGDQNKLIDAAIAAGVQRFVPSEFGINTQDDRTRTIIPVLNAKVETLKYLKGKEDQISWSVFITGMFFDWCLKIGILGFDASSKTATLFDDGKATFSTTNNHTIGLALVKALEKPETTKNQHIYVSSFQTSQREILSAIENITGEKWSVNTVKTEDHIEGGRTKIQQGDFSGVISLIQGATFGEEKQLGDYSSAGLWNEKLGLEPESFEDSIRAGLAGKLTWEV